MLTKVKGEPQAAEEAWPAVNISAKNRFCCSIPSASYTPGEECSGLVWEFLTDPDEQSLPNCHFVDPDKIIKHLLNGSGPLGQPNSSDICEFFQKFDDDTKLLVSSSWLTRAIQSSPNFGEQEEALAKFILVRNAINDFEERKKCYRKGKKVANLHGSNHPARSRRKSRNPKKIELMESGPSSFQTNGHETTRVCHTQNGFVLDATNRSPSSSALNTSTSRDGEGSHSYAQPPSPSCKQMMTVSDMKKLLKELFPNRHQALVKHVLSLIWSSKTNDMTQKELIVLLGLKNTKFIERIMQVRDSIKESGDSLLTDLDFNSQTYSTESQESTDENVADFGIKKEETKERPQDEVHEESYCGSTVSRSQSPSHRRRRRKSHNPACRDCGAEFNEEGTLSLSDSEEILPKSSKARKRKSRSLGASSVEKSEKQEGDSKRPKKDTSCPFCGRIFATMQTRKRHILRSHPDRKNDEAVDLHMYKSQPSKELPFICTKCNKTFSNVSSLNMHRKSIHEGIKNHVCRVCKKAYPRGCDLRKHVKRVHEKNLLLPHTVVF